MCIYNIIYEIIWNFKLMLGKETYYDIDYEYIFEKLFKILGYIIILPLGILSDVLTSPMQLLAFVIFKIKEYKKIKRTVINKMNRYEQK